MLATIEQRLRDDPDHADSWRILAKLQNRRGDTAAAFASLERALEADPESVATHFDLGQLLESSGDSISAASHFAMVCRLAPDSSYAHRLIEQGFVPQESGIPDASIMPVGYEIKTFDGDESFLRQLDTMESAAKTSDSRWRAMVETGLLYNSNVSLTPISRQLASVDASSLQGFFNPEIEFNWHDGPWLRTGPLLRGYFAVNEQQQSNFDLAAFQGGWFAQRDHDLLGQDWIARLDYIYSIDLQGGTRFADRHAINLSATSISARGDLLYIYGTLSHSDFADDGVDPTLDSLDGPSFIAGITRYVRLSSGYVRTVRIGGDLSAANTQGSDYRFIGAGIHGGIMIALRERLYLEPELGLGFRDYDDYTGPVDRDEVVLRLGARLERRITDRLTIGAVIGYNRFASDNENFDAERTEGGIVTSWLY